MLILSRKANESICIGDDIVVTVTDLIGQRVKIGIAAPREMPITRGELLALPQPPAAPVKGVNTDGV